MNQIVSTPMEKEEPASVPPSKKSLRFFRYQFYISAGLAILGLILLGILWYTKSQKEMQSTQLLQTYQIATLYSTDSSVSSIVPEDASFIIGAIYMDKIRLHYPILSTLSDENLRIAPCRIAGPLPNEMGNLCIAGHNYVDTKLFSRLHELALDDTIVLYDLQGNAVEYAIYAMYEVEPDDVSCLEARFENACEITLITCNNVTGNRLIVKALAPSSEEQ